MKLSVIICCYNERDTIADVIAQTRAVQLGAGWEREIIVVDNASTDGTREILQQVNEPDVRTIFHERNKGKGMSIRTGIAHMRGDYMIIQDADKEYSPAEHARFCEKVDQTGTPALFGSRVLGGQVKYKYAHAYWGVRFLTAVTNRLFGGNLTDVATATKMVRADVIQSLNLTTTDFNLDFEMPAKVLLAGHDILEIPIDYNPRTYEEGKKISSLDGLKALFTLLRVRLGLTPLYRSSAQPQDVEQQALQNNKVNVRTND